MFARRASRGLWLAGLAPAGVVGGHALAYLAAIPGSGERQAFMHETGHSYWPVAVLAAAAAALCVAGALVVRHARAGALGRSLRPELSGWLATRLAAVQIVLFLALEAGERALSGSPVLSLMHSGLLLKGLGAQVLVAVVATLLLRWLATVAEAAGRMLSGLLKRAPARIAFPFPTSTLWVRRGLTSSLAARAPPR